MNTQIDLNWKRDAHRQELSVADGSRNERGSVTNTVSRCWAWAMRGVEKGKGKRGEGSLE